MRINQPYGVRYEYEEFSEEPKKRYFIACEGKKTEYKYFKGIMDNKVEIKINPLIEIIPINHDPNTGSNPLHIYQEAIEAIKTAPNYLAGDDLCIIVDRDRSSFSEAQYTQLLQADTNKEIRFCVSNPCFELWLLLHFSDCSEYSQNDIFENAKDGNRTYVEKCLMAKLGGSYNKARIHFEDNFKDKIRIAILNSKLYETSLTELKDKIGTNIGLLIEEMLDKESDSQ